MENIEKTFEDFNLREELLKAIRHKGFTTPTPVQAEVLGLENILERDLIVQARTGSGKTLAFSLPLLNDLQADRSVPKILILSPTRELAQQTAREISWSGASMGVGVAALVGGVAIGPQLGTLRRGATVVVGTPGRVLDHIRRGSLRVDGINSVVLDEGDHMLDLGFRDEMEAILQGIGDVERTWLFSATMPPEVRHLARRYLDSPAFIALSQDERVNDDIRHKVYLTPAARRFEGLVNLLLWESPTRAIIFCSTRAETGQVALRLERAGFPAESLHGDMGQRERNHALEVFRNSRSGLLVATDVAARGLDISGVSHVIQIGLPSNLESFVHRSGRTGRAGHQGVNIALLNVMEGRKLKGLIRNFGVTPEWLPIPDRHDIDRLSRMRLREQIGSWEIDSPYESMAEEILAETDALSTVTFLLHHLMEGKSRAFELRKELDKEREREKYQRPQGQWKDRQRRDFRSGGKRYSRSGPASQQNRRGGR